MTAPTENLVKLPGGLRLPANKSLSTGAPVEDVAVPARLTIPARQHAGDAAEPIVGVGDYVYRGQPLADCSGAVSAAVHASSSGIVCAIGEAAIAWRGQPRVTCISVDTDGKDAPWEGFSPGVAPDALTPAELLHLIERGGIVGLGGAAYPTAAKLAHGVGIGVEALILNGVECESYISCDDRLMREQAHEVLRGAAILLRALTIDRCLIAVESDKSEAWTALREAHEELGDERLTLVQIPTVYPAGGEDQLVLLVAGEEVPSGGLPQDAGYVVHNVGTAVAVADLIDHGQPLISRIVTVTGEGVHRPGNYRVRLGTSIADVIAAAGGYNERATRLIMGGPMTGVTLTSDELPVIKATNCLLVTGAAVRLSPEPERSCIRCGECAEHCPVRLLPQQLYRYANARDSQRLRTYGLDDCIECGCCDLVCPSHIPLTQTYREAKGALRIEAHEKLRAERARERYQGHADRALAEDQAQREALEQKKSAAGADAIDAILKRARDRKKP